MKLIPCDCGGTMRPALLKSIDLTQDLGLPVTVHRIQGERCDKCGWQTLPGPAFEVVRRAVAVQLVQQTERLGPAQARFLRTFLGLIQQELAKRMGITRKTIVEWEGKGRISPQNDLLLRTLVFAHLDADKRPPGEAIDHVRTAAPKVRPAPIILQAA